VPLSNIVFLVLLLVVAPAFFFYLILAPYRAIQQEQKDTLLNGIAATGTVVAINNPVSAKGLGTMWVVSVEIKSLDLIDPVRFDATYGTWLFGWRKKRLEQLGTHQSVAIHYRNDFPISGVIDQLVKR
jgi:hypothetical protein